MIALLCFFLTLFASLFKSKSRLEAENAALRHQLIVLQRKTRGRVHLTNRDRLFLVHLYRWFPSVLKAITIIRPETLVRWHRAGFRQYWRWKSRSLGGRPRIAADLRVLIRQMSAENPLWGAPRELGRLPQMLPPRGCDGDARLGPARLISVSPSEKPRHNAFAGVNVLAVPRAFEPFACRSD